jgi:hypothetical protein
MCWQSDDLERIGDSEELKITSFRSDGSQRRWTPIWVVSVDQDLFIRAAQGMTADWYRHVMLHKSARIKVHRLETDVSLELVDDQALILRVTSAYEAKYGRQRNLVSMFLVAPATASTLRLVSPST